MFLAISPEDQHRWLTAYTGAAQALAAQKASELRQLTPADALRDTDLLLQAAAEAWLAPNRRHTSGLVEQQRLFATAR